MPMLFTNAKAPDNPMLSSTPEQRARIILPLPSWQGLHINPPGRSGSNAPRRRRQSPSRPRPRPRPRLGANG
jgi:hypothetical protein